MPPFFLVHVLRPSNPRVTPTRFESHLLSGRTDPKRFFLPSSQRERVCHEPSLSESFPSSFFPSSLSFSSEDRSSFCNIQEGEVGFLHQHHLRSPIRTRRGWSRTCVFERWCLSVDILSHLTTYESLRTMAHSIGIDVDLVSGSFFSDELAVHPFECGTLRRSLSFDDSARLYYFLSFLLNLVPFSSSFSSTPNDSSQRISMPPVVLEHESRSSSQRTVLILARTRKLSCLCSSAKRELNSQYSSVRVSIGDSHSI